MNPAEQANALLSNLETSRSLSKIDPLLDLRADIVSFFKERMSMVREVEEFRRQVRARMVDQADTLNFDQLERLHGLLGSDARQNAEAVIGLFKAAPGAPSPLGEMMKEKNPEEEEKNRIAKELSSDKLKAVEQFFQIISRISAEGSLEE